MRCMIKNGTTVFSAQMTKQVRHMIKVNDIKEKSYS